MAEKKRSQGYLLGGCLLLLVVGGALSVVGLAGGGAWFFLRTRPPVEGESAEAVSVPPPPIPSFEAGEPQPATPDVALPSPIPAEEPALSSGEAHELASARSALEEANTYEEPSRTTSHAAAPSPAGSSSGGSSSSGSSSGGSSSSGSSGGSSSSGSSAPPAEPPPASVGSGQNVRVEGPATVVLVGSAGRFPVPGRVAPGRYEIEATFPGDPPVNFGGFTVSSGGSYTVVCNPKMAICRAH